MSAGYFSMTARNVNRGTRSHMAFMRSLDDNKPVNASARDTYLSADEISSHCHEWDCWIVLDACVYDVSQYLEYHPGGKEEILLYAGHDATVAFQKIHAWVNYEAILGKFRVGSFKATVVVSASRERPSKPKTSISALFNWLLGRNQ